MDTKTIMVRLKYAPGRERKGIISEDGPIENISVSFIRDGSSWVLNQEGIMKIIDIENPEEILDELNEGESLKARELKINASSAGPEFLYESLDAPILKGGIIRRTRRRNKRKSAKRRKSRRNRRSRKH